MAMNMTTGVLEPLSQTERDLADPNEDIRGRKVYDRDGAEIGKVDDVFIDPTERRARFVSVKSGDILGLGGRRYLVPVDAISVTGDRVMIDATADRIAAGPQVNGEFDLTGQRRAPAGTEASEAGMPAPGTDATGDTADVSRETSAEPIVVAVYRFYAVQEPFWSPSYQRPNWS